MRRLTMRLAALSVATAFAGKASSAPHASLVRPVRSLAELRNQQMVRQKWDLSCGAAAVATIFTYQLGRPTTEATVARAMLGRTSASLVRARLGFSLFDLKVYAATRGFGAAGFSGLSLAELDAIAPAIVPLRVHGFRHFVVYRGRRDDRVLLADPSFGNRTLRSDLFTRIWAGGIGFRLFDPAEPDPPNRMGVPAVLLMIPGEQAARTRVEAWRGGGT